MSSSVFLFFFPFFLRPFLLIYFFFLLSLFPLIFASSSFPSSFLPFPFSFLFSLLTLILPSFLLHSLPLSSLLSFLSSSLLPLFFPSFSSSFFFFLSFQFISPSPSSVLPFLLFFIFFPSSSSLPSSTFLFPYHTILCSLLQLVFEPFPPSPLPPFSPPSSPPPPSSAPSLHTWRGQVTWAAANHLLCLPDPLICRSYLRASSVSQQSLPLSLTHTESRLIHFLVPFFPKSSFFVWMYAIM